MKTRILYVEDNEDNKIIVRAILESMNYDVLEAERGETALEMMRHTPPDLVLMDMHLPGMNGLETTIQMKQDPTLSNIPVIALTADHLAQKAFIKAGCDAFLTKPIRQGTLLRTITQVLRTRE